MEAVKTACPRPLRGELLATLLTLGASAAPILSTPCAKVEEPASGERDHHRGPLVVDVEVLDVVVHRADADGEVVLK